MEGGELSPEKLLLLVLAVGYIVVTAVYALWQSRSAESLLRTIKRNESPELWESIGAPESMRAAVRDPQLRLRKFMRNKTYRHTCNPGTIEKIEQFRRQTAIGLAVLAITAGGILVRFWPLLRPYLLPA